MKMDIDRLPPELKEEIFLKFNTQTYAQITRASDEWKEYVYNSKKMMQRVDKELSNFYFFYIVWYGFSFYDKSKYVFPISTVDQFYFLFNFGQDPHAQIGALEKTTGWESLLHGSRYSYFYTNDVLQDLISHMKTDVKQSIYYLDLFIDKVKFFNSGFDRPVVVNPPSFSRADKLKLLEGKHYAMSNGPWNDSGDTGDGDSGDSMRGALYISLKNYPKIVAIREKLKEELQFEAEFRELQKKHSNIPQLADRVREYDARAQEYANLTESLQGRYDELDKGEAALMSRMWRFASEYDDKAEEGRGQLRKKTYELLGSKVPLNILTAPLIKSLFKPRWLNHMGEVELKPADYENKLRRFFSLVKKDTIDYLMT